MSPVPTIIDTDIHNTLAAASDLFPYLPEYFVANIKQQGIPGGSHPWRSPIGVMRSDAAPPNGGSPASDPAYTLQHHFEPNGIEYGVLTGNMMHVSQWGDPDYGNALASAVNDALAEVWLSHSPRYLGSILINHSDPVAAAKEIDRKAGDRRFVQVIMASAARVLFGQRFYHPIYEAAERNGLPVAFHPGSEGSGTSGPPTPSGYPTRYFEWHNILPTNYMAQINSLVCEGVFEKFPKLKIVALEGGVSWLPHLMWRMDKNYKALRHSAPWLKRLPSEYIIEHVRLSTQPVEEPPDPGWLLDIFKMIQAEKILMFSSDYPHWDNDDPKYILNQLPAAMKRRIYSDNARELYRLPAPGALDLPASSEGNLAPELAGVN